jgi:hypothetical protein
MGDLRKVLILMLENPEGDIHTPLMTIQISFRPLAMTCRRMGLQGEADWLERLAGIDSEVRKKSPAAKPADYSRHSGALEQGRFGHIGGLPSAEDRKPDRLAEYVVADRFTAVTGVLVAFFIMVGAFIEILRRGALPRGLACGLAPLFRSSDWVWLFGLGLVFSVAWWAGLTWLSPLGCRDIGLTYFKFNRFPTMQPWLSQGLGGLVLILVMLVQTARWRWAKRGAFLALRPERMWIGWTMATVAALFIPAQGIVRYLPAHEVKFLLYGSAAGGIPLLWLLWQATMGIFTSNENALGGQLMLRVLMPAVIAMALLLLGAVPLLRKYERHWVAEMERYSWNSWGFGFVKSEGSEVEAVRQALLDALQ